MYIINLTPGAIDSGMNGIKQISTHCEDAAARVGSAAGEISELRFSSQTVLAANIRNIQKRLSKQTSLMEQYSTAMREAQNELMAADGSFGDASETILRRIIMWLTPIPQKLALLLQETIGMNAATAGLFLSGGSAAVITSVNAVLDFLRDFFKGREEVRHEVTGEEIEAYLQNHDINKLFASYGFAGHYFATDLSWWDLYGIYLKNADKALFDYFVLGHTSPEEMLDLFMNNPEKCRGILRGVIDEMCSTEYLDIASPSDEQMLSILKEVAEASGFSDVADMMDTFNTATGSAELVDKMFKDYAVNILMLESIKGMAPNSGVLSDTIDELIQEYKNQSQTLLFDEIKDKAVDGMVDLADFAFGTGLKGVFTVADKVLGKVPAVTGAESAIASVSLASDSVLAFKKAAEVIQSGNYTQADIAAYTNSFNLAKALRIEQYEAMREYYGSDSVKGAYLTDCIDKLESMSSTNFVYAKSFSDYL